MAKEKDSLDAAIAETMKDVEFPDLKAILCHFMRKSGGASGVAGMLRREYKAAKEGSMIRAMVLNMILQGAKSVSSKENSRDSSLISDDDIEREAASLLGKVKPNAGTDNRS